MSFTVTSGGGKVFYRSTERKGEIVMWIVQEEWGGIVQDYCDFSLTQQLLSTTRRVKLTVSPLLPCVMLWTDSPSSRVYVAGTMSPADEQLCLWTTPPPLQDKKQNTLPPDLSALKWLDWPSVSLLRDSQDPTSSTCSPDSKEDKCCLLAG